jgi:uncharacterized protein YjiS (DUF1127 family)
MQQQMKLSQFPTIGDIHFDFPTLSELINRIQKLIVTWNNRRRSRRQLARVDNHILKDIGISEATRFIEVNNSFWDH